MMELGDEDASANSVWVRHTGGMFTSSEFCYVYRNSFDFRIESFGMNYKDGQLTTREYTGTATIIGALHLSLESAMIPGIMRAPCIPILLECRSTTSRVPHGGTLV
jgi:hypothetical protein